MPAIFGKEVRQELKPPSSWSRESLSASSAKRSPIDAFINHYNHRQFLYQCVKVHLDVEIKRFAIGGVHSLNRDKSTVSKLPNRHLENLGGRSHLNRSSLADGEGGLFGGRLRSSATRASILRSLCQLDDNTRSSRNLPDAFGRLLLQPLQ